MTTSNIRKTLVEIWKQKALNHIGFTGDMLVLVKEKFNVSGDLKVVDGFESYAISDDGRLFTCRPTTKNIAPIREMKQSSNKTGHKFCHLHDGKTGTLRLIHRLVAIGFLPQPEPRQTVVRHLDGNPANNHYLNLAWGTQKENMEDCVRHGNTLKGIKSANAKLNDNRVVLIRGLAAEGFSLSCIAEFFGVSTETVRRATVGESWGHVA
jgi:hypothetical protein